MRVVYPFVQEFPDALNVLFPHDIERVALGPNADAYWRLMRDLWRSGDDFLIVEQDIVLPAGAVAEFDTCPRDWCAQPYFMWGTWGAWHGAVRYRGSLTAQFPSLPDDVAKRDWQSLDSAWINQLRLHGRNEAHWHWPPARHLNPIHPQPPVSLFSAGRYLADLTRDDDPLARYRASLRLTMTDEIL
jgi:hypothetical protein